MISILNFKKKIILKASQKLLVSMLGNQSESTKYKVYKTLFENKISGFVFIAYHGDTATYLIGWSLMKVENKM